MGKSLTLIIFKYFQGKKIKEDLNNCRDMLCSWISMLTVVKTSACPKLIYRPLDSMQSQTKSQKPFWRNWHAHSKLYMHCQENLKDGRKTGEVTLSYFRRIKSYRNKTVWYCHNKERDRIEKSRNEIIQTQSLDFWQRCQYDSTGEKRTFQ